MNLYQTLAAILVYLAPGMVCACTKITSCSCELSDGSIIDLSPLASANGTARFWAVRDENDKDLFSYNPCLGFTEYDCINVAVCQIKPSVPRPAFYNIGTQSSAIFLENDQGGVTIEYAGEMWDVLRISYVTLVCDEKEEGQLIIYGERPPDDDITKFDLEFRTKYACAVGGSRGLSVGTILLIIAGSCFGLFFLVGIPLQVFIKKETGASVVPGSNFFMALPGLIKDGACFVVRRGNRSQYEHA